MHQPKRILSALLGCGFSLLLFNCGGYDSEGGWDEPTTGVITTVKEVGAGDFKIASEEPVATVEESLLIIEPLQGPNDTLTLAEAKAIAAQDTSSSNQNTQNRAVRRSGMGFFGYMMLGRMMGGINRGAYVNSGAYSRASSTTGSRMQSSARRVGGSGRNSGFGGRSTRSVGG